MFISWAVTSYQSDGAGCDFSQGISVCLIEIPYPIRATLDESLSPFYYVLHISPLSRFSPFFPSASPLLCRYTHLFLLIFRSVRLYFGLRSRFPLPPSRILFSCRCYRINNMLNCPAASLISTDFTVF